LLDCGMLRFKAIFIVEKLPDKVNALSKLKLLGLECRKISDAIFYFCQPVARFTFVSLCALVVMCSRVLISGLWGQLRLLAASPHKLKWPTCERSVCVLFHECDCKNRVRRKTETCGRNAESALLFFSEFWRIYFL